MSDQCGPRKSVKLYMSLDHRIKQWLIEKFERKVFSTAERGERLRVKLILYFDRLGHYFFMLGQRLIPDDWFLPDLEEARKKLEKSTVVYLCYLINGGIALREEFGELQVVPLVSYIQKGDLLFHPFMPRELVPKLKEKTNRFKERVYVHLGSTGQHTMVLTIIYRNMVSPVAIIFNQGKYVCTNKIIAQAIEESSDFQDGVVIRIKEDELNAVRNFGKVKRTQVPNSGLALRRRSDGEVARFRNNYRG